MTEIGIAWLLIVTFILYWMIIYQRNRIKAAHQRLNRIEDVLKLRPLFDPENPECPK